MHLEGMLHMRSDNKMSGVKVLWFQIDSLRQAVVFPVYHDIFKAGQLRYVQDEVPWLFAPFATE